MHLTKYLSIVDYYQIILYNGAKQLKIHFFKFAIKKSTKIHNKHHLIYILYMSHKNISSES